MSDADIMLVLKNRYKNPKKDWKPVFPNWNIHHLKKKQMQNCEFHDY